MIYLLENCRVSNHNEPDRVNEYNQQFHKFELMNPDNTAKMLWESIFSSASDSNIIFVMSRSITLQGRKDESGQRPTRNRNISRHYRSLPRQTGSEVK